MTPRLFRTLAVVTGAGATAAIAAAAMAVVMLGKLEALFLLGPLGGATAALVVGAFQSGRPPSKLTVPDPFARDFSLFDVVNIAHVRVAGVGGLGLMLVAISVVLQYQLLTAAYVIGIVGGMCCGTALIVYRRTHRAIRPSQSFEHL